MSIARVALVLSVACLGSALLPRVAAQQAAQRAAPPAAQEPGKERLTFEDTRKVISWQGNVPAAHWAWDGLHLELLQGKQVVWLDPATGKVVDTQPQPLATTDAAAGTAASTNGKPSLRARIWQGDLWVEPATDGDRRERSGGRRANRGQARGSPSSGPPGEGAVQLTTDGIAGPKQQAHVSGDSAFASFVRDGDLFAVDVAQKNVWRITRDGGSRQLHGILDWVYQEEVYGRGDFQGHWWSPQGARCAFLSLDESKVKDYPITNHVPEGFLDRERAVATVATIYPKAGDANPKATLSIADAATHKVVPVDLQGYPADVLIVRVEWTADGRTLLVTLQDRIQTWADLCAVDPQTGALQRWIREESPTWVNRPDPPQWLPDGSFLWLSERTGYQHVYRYRPAGTPGSSLPMPPGLVGAVTSGDWQVRSIERVDFDQGVLWFTGTKDGAAGSHLYRIGLDGKGLVNVTPGPGTHGGEPSKDGRYVIDTWSSMADRTAVRLLDGATGALVRPIGQADQGAAGRYAFAERRFLQIPARDGCLLDASLQLPTETAPGKVHPVYLPTYSGPDAPSVRDAWGPSTYQQFLSQQGFITLQVNVRTASGRGQAHIGRCYRQLGVQELQDLEDAVDFVCKEHHGDPARVAIEGWSYGGFMAAFALTHSHKFALGLAGAGVYDWRLYDSIYTERYMRTPEENRSGYDATSVIKAAADLHGHLVLLHGTMDDNVHLQNTVQLLWELEKAGKQNFELMLYPRSQHGLAAEVAAHSRAYQWRQLAKLLDPAFKAE